MEFGYDLSSLDKGVLAPELAIAEIKTGGVTPSELSNDVSLLTLPPSNGSDFLFDWFFTSG